VKARIIDRLHIKDRGANPFSTYTTESVQTFQEKSQKLKQRIVTYGFREDIFICMLNAANFLGHLSERGHSHS